MSHTPGPWKAIKRGVNNDWLVIPCDRERMPDNWITEWIASYCSGIIAECEVSPCDT